MTTRQISIFFPPEIREALDREATDREVSVAELVREAVAMWLVTSEREKSPLMVVVGPDVTPIAPPLSAVTTQRQGERCYHMHRDGVTRWHLDTMPCPSEGNWAKELEAADLAALPPEMIPAN